MLSGWVLLGQFKPFLPLSMPTKLDGYLYFWHPVQHPTSKPSSSSSSAGAAQALLSLPVGWGSPGEQQHVQPGEAWWQNSAARSGSSWQHQQPDVHGPRAAGWKTSCPCQVHSSSHVWAVSGIVRLRAWRGLQLLPWCQGCGAKHVQGLQDTNHACAWFRHTQARATHVALRTALTLIEAQLQQFVSTWIYLVFG